ncbi:MAG: flavodoxin domain-containing protein [Candidatus Promineifilaceae bacterium]|nr:flavodoxin domain-containing protein [Candidatus Promineifilaceae bacterium]
MKILVLVESKHGSTDEIAQAITHELSQAGHQVELYDAQEAPPPAGYDAVVAGSAIYVGRWMGEARTYVHQHADALRERPVWLFSSGPLGKEPQPVGEPEEIPELVAASGARGHRNFVGKLDKDELGLAERLVVRAVKAPYGDFRNWEGIRSWAHEIAAALEAEEAVAEMPIADRRA